MIKATEDIQCQCCIHNSVCSEMYDKARIKILMESINKALNNITPTSTYLKATISCKHFKYD